ncbi:5371_t:CDS:2 [Cetraspora pellucida]|uniref:5371_t:CDS:1 n=1 Tax=Cetraspora pellucida TaxID=1433469 RepID=A0A9N8WD25_9GLOM|nr:5371_t:CDS:2 [Cetraspora pellucida]
MSSERNVNGHSPLTSKPHFGPLANLGVWLIDFDTICAKKEFSLPSEILTPQVIAERSSTRFPARQSRPNGPYSFDLGEGSSASTLTSHKTIKRTYANGNNENYSTSAWRSFQGRSYTARKRKNSRQLDEEEIRALPEQPKYEKYNARAFSENPFMKQTTPSTLVKGSYKLNAEKIERSFLQACFNQHVNALIQAAEWLENNHI